MNCSAEHQTTSGKILTAWNGLLVHQALRFNFCFENRAQHFRQLFQSLYDIQNMLGFVARLMRLELPASVLIFIAHPVLIDSELLKLETSYFPLRSGLLKKLRLISAYIHTFQLIFGDSFQHFDGNRRVLASKLFNFRDKLSIDPASIHRKVSELPVSSFASDICKSENPSFILLHHSGKWIWGGSPVPASSKWLGFSSKYIPISPCSQSGSIGQHREHWDLKYFWKILSGSPEPNKRFENPKKKEQCFLSLHYKT